jgi:uncharacterized membrane protein YeaQ/YmgE (transglycosylase-associated protein family)
LDQLPIPGFLMVILIGAVVGVAARFLYLGPNTLHGFILTVILGLIGATLATYVDRVIGLVDRNQLADPISMVIGAMIVLFIWNRLAARRIVYDPGMHHPSVAKQSDSSEAT